jgi:protein disulfide-isomerase-like protein
MHENGVHAVVLDKDSFDTFMAENDMAMVNFYAPWCIWCQRLHPTYEQFAEKVEEEGMPIGVAQVDCVENSDLCAKQKIAAFPTLRWFNKQTAVMPDYKGDRTVNALNSFSARKLEADEKYQKWEEAAAKVSPLGKKGERVAGALI